MKIDFGQFFEKNIKDGKIFYVYMNYTEGSTTVNWNPVTKDKHYISYGNNDQKNENQIDIVLRRLGNICKGNKYEKILINVDHLGNNGALSKLNPTLSNKFKDAITALKQQQHGQPHGQQHGQQQGQQQGQQHGQPHRQPQQQGFMPPRGQELNHMQRQPFQNPKEGQFQIKEALEKAQRARLTRKSSATKHTSIRSSSRSRKSSASKSKSRSKRTRKSTSKHRPAKNTRTKGLLETMRDRIDEAEEICDTCKKSKRLLKQPLFNSRKFKITQKFINRLLQSKQDCNECLKLCKFISRKVDKVRKDKDVFSVRYPKICRKDFYGNIEADEIRKNLHGKLLQQYKKLNQ